jgi:hypothetical protein
MSTEREEWIAAVDRLDKCEQTLADLRAKVEDLSAVLIPSSTILWLSRDAVLDLIDGSSDG